MHLFLKFFVVGMGVGIFKAHLFLSIATNSPLSILTHSPSYCKRFFAKFLERKKKGTKKGGEGFYKQFDEEWRSFL